MAGRTLEQLEVFVETHVEESNRRHDGAEKNHTETIAELRGIREDLQGYTMAIKPIIDLYTSGGMLKRGAIAILALIGTIVAITLGVKNILK